MADWLKNSNWSYHLIKALAYFHTRKRCSAYMCDGSKVADVSFTFFDHKSSVTLVQLRTAVSVLYRAWKRLSHRKKKKKRHTNAKSSTVCYLNSDMPTKMTAERSEVDGERKRERCLRMSLSFIWSHEIFTMWSLYTVFEKERDRRTDRDRQTDRKREREREMLSWCDFALMY